MFRGRLERWVECDDVLHDAYLRLCRALDEEKPPTLERFFALATTMSRRELTDLARHLFGKEGSAANHTTASGGRRTEDGSPRYDAPESTHDPGRLAFWTEFHQRVAELPPEVRAVFEPVWYQELPQAEAAELLGVSVPTFKRRMAEARVCPCRARIPSPPSSGGCSRSAPRIAWG
jgi:RNA polymerase sigma factor (sigma-70 family)